MKSYLKPSKKSNSTEQFTHNYVFDSNARLAEQIQQNSEKPLTSIFPKEISNAAISDLTSSLADTDVASVSAPQAPASEVLASAANSSISPAYCPIPESSSMMPVSSTGLSSSQGNAPTVTNSATGFSLNPPNVSIPMVPEFSEITAEADGIGISAPHSPSQDLSAPPSNPSLPSAPPSNPSSPSSSPSNPSSSSSDQQPVSNNSSPQDVSTPGTQSPSSTGNGTVTEDFPPSLVEGSVSAPNTSPPDIEAPSNPSEGAGSIVEPPAISGPATSEIEVPIVEPPVITGPQTPSPVEVTPDPPAISDPVAPENQAPSILSLQALPSIVDAGGLVDVSGLAKDPDNDQLHWKWIWSGKGIESSGTKSGDALSQTGLMTSPTAQAGSDVYTFTTQVSDGNLSSESHSVDVEIKDTNVPPGPENQAPSIVSLEALPSTVDAGGVVDVSGLAKDPDNDQLYWKWTWSGKGIEASGGSTGDALSQTDLKTSSAAQAESDVYTFTAEVSDGSLSTQPHSVEVNILENRDVPTPINQNRAPSITTLLPDSFVVQAGTSVNVQGYAQDPDNDHLTWHWVWKGAGVEQTGTGSGNDLLQKSLPTSKDAKAGTDQYTFSTYVTDGSLNSQQRAVNVSIGGGGVSNRPPEIRSMWMPSNQVSWGEKAKVSINATDPDRDPLSWKFQWTGSNGFNKEEIEPGPANWLEAAININETDMKRGDVLTLAATVSDPSGLSDSDTIDIHVTNAPPKIKKLESNKDSYFMTDEAKIVAAAKDRDGDELFWKYSWQGNGVSGEGDFGPKNRLKYGIDLNETRAVPGEEVTTTVVVFDKFGGSDSATITLPIDDVDYETDKIGALEVWFETKSAQNTTVGKNQPPVIEMLGLSNGAVIPGQDVDITGKAFDEEGMDLTWSWQWRGVGVDQTGTSRGDDIALGDMPTSKEAKAGRDLYTFSAIVNDGLDDSKKRSVDLKIQNKPPVIEHLTIDRTIEEGEDAVLRGDGFDPMGQNDKLDWSISTTGVLERARTGSAESQITDREKFDLVYPGLSEGSGTAHVTLTNEAGLTDKQSVSVTVEEEDLDPLMLDLNRDGKINIVGEQVAQNTVSLPPGKWVISTEKEGNLATRYLINDTNRGGGAHPAAIENSVEVHSTGRWGMGIEQRSEEAWTAIDVEKMGEFKPSKDSSKSGAGRVVIRAGGAKIIATRTSDEGYEDDGLGVNTVAGELVEFDMDPNSQSWREGSENLRPGLQNNKTVPLVKNGRVVYDTGKKERISKSGAWVEDPSKGDSAKIFDQSGNWVAEWIKGEPSVYYWGDRKSVERTQWMAGDGDGMIVWDHNNDGIISDATELMSEFDKDGKKAFANGYEKLAHYFDRNNDGLIEGSELDGLKLWVDDGDAKTETGELRELADYGIFEIEIPKDGSWGSEATTLGMNTVVDLGFMAVLTTRPKDAKRERCLAKLNSGTSVKDFIQELLDSAKFKNEILPQGLKKVVLDIIKNLQYRIASNDEISAGVKRFKQGEGAEFIIDVMNDPSVVQRFKENS